MKIYCPNCFYPNESLQKICEKCGKAINWADESYENKLIKALLHKDPRIVLRAAEILSNFKSNRVRKALIKTIFASKDPYVQAAAVSSLSNNSSMETFKVFREIAINGSLQARIRAIEALGKTSTLREIDLLEKLKKDKSMTIREKAEEAIKNIKKRHVI
ncbi:MAG: HEAT repeat domain-containing protein [Candidatus Humimicrobiaceae bacterium]